MPDLNQILIFVHVVDRGSMRAAAEQLGVAKSGVSRSIAALEARLGVRLLERTSRALRMTPEGQELYEQGRRAIGMLDEAESQLRIRKDRHEGLLRVSAAAYLGRTLLAAVVPEFIARFPRARVVVDADDRLVHVVSDAVDIAVRIGPSPSDSTLVSRRIAQPSAALLASPAYLAEAGVPGDVDELPGHRLLAYGPGHRTSRWVLQRSGADGALQTHTVEIAPVVASNDLVLLLAAVRAGQGIALLPHALAAGPAPQQELVAVLPEWRHEPVDVRAVHASHRSVTPLMRAFLDLLAERAPQLLER